VTAALTGMLPLSICGGGGGQGVGKHDRVWKRLRVYVTEAAKDGKALEAVMEHFFHSCVDLSVFSQEGEGSSSAQYTFAYPLHSPTAHPLDALVMWICRQAEAISLGLEMQFRDALAG